MSSPVDVSLALIPAPPDALRSIAVTDQAVSGPRACSRSRKSLPLRLPTSAVSNFASTDAKKAHLPLERKESAAGSRKFLAKITQSNTAVASISIRNSGSARAETPIQVLAGGFSEEKVSLKTAPTAVPHSA